MGIRAFLCQGGVGLIGLFDLLLEDRDVAEDALEVERAGGIFEEAGGIGDAGDGGAFGDGAELRSFLFDGQVIGFVKVDAEAVDAFRGDL